jgi:hypothetical protein
MFKVIRIARQTDSLYLRIRPSDPALGAGLRFKLFDGWRSRPAPLVPERAYSISNSRKSSPDTAPNQSPSDSAWASLGQTALRCTRASKCASASPGSDTASHSSFGCGAAGDEAGCPESREQNATGTFGVERCAWVRFSEGAKVFSDIGNVPIVALLERAAATAYISQRSGASLKFVAEPERCVA